MRPAHFDARMRALGWRLARIASTGHHIYHDASGASLTLNATNAHNAPRYLARYAKRDQRPAGERQPGWARYPW